MAHVFRLIVATVLLAGGGSAWADKFVVVENSGAAPGFDISAGSCEAAADAYLARASASGDMIFKRNSECEGGPTDFNVRHYWTYPSGRWGSAGWLVIRKEVSQCKAGEPTGELDYPGSRGSFSSCVQGCMAEMTAVTPVLECSGTGTSACTYKTRMSGKLTGQSCSAASGDPPSTNPPPCPSGMSGGYINGIEACVPSSGTGSGSGSGSGSGGGTGSGSGSGSGSGGSGTGSGGSGTEGGGGSQGGSGGSGSGSGSGSGGGTGGGGSGSGTGTGSGSGTGGTGSGGSGTGTGGGGTGAGTGSGDGTGNGSGSGTGNGSGSGTGNGSGSGTGNGSGSGTGTGSGSGTGNGSGSGTGNGSGSGTGNGSGSGTGNGSGSGTGNGSGSGTGNGNCTGTDCKDGSSFGGSCGAWTCDGDAIMCAIGKEQHQRNCQMFEDAAQSQEAKLYEASKGKTGSVTGDLPGNETVSMQGRYSDANLLSGACVTDLTFDVLGKPFVMPLSRICPHLELLKTMLLAFGAVLWVVIVFR